MPMIAPRSVISSVVFALYLVPAATLAQSQSAGLGATAETRDGNKIIRVTP